MKKFLNIAELFSIIGVIIGCFTSTFLLLFFILLYIIIQNLKKKDLNYINIKNEQETLENVSNEVYCTKAFLTKNEFDFYLKLKKIEELGYIIVPQVNLASIIDKHSSKYRTELFRNIDFGIFDTHFNLKLLIELNDSSHNQINRKDRDLKVKKILNDCKIRLLYFYTKYPNEEDYVIHRVYEAINGTKSNNEATSND